MLLGGKFWVGTAATLAAVLVSCSDGDERPPRLGAEGAPTERLPETSASYRTIRCPVLPPAGVAIDCGAVTVPEDHAHPAGPTIDIAVVRFFSRSTTPSEIPVVYLEGGPGGAAIDAVSNGFSAFGHLLRDHDLVVLDQRGTGYSRPRLDCPETDGVSVAVGNAENDLLVALQACRDRLVREDANLDVYNTAQNAADVDAVRQALGYEQWSLYGISYGTRLALTTVREHPDGVHSVVLDGILPLEVDTLAGVPASAERSFGLVFEYCAADPFCRRQFPAPMSQLVEVMNRLETEPAPLTLLDGTPLDLSGEMVLGLLFLLLYDRESIPFVPALIDLTATGDYALYESVFSTLNESPLVALGMYLSVVCADDAPFSSPAAITSAAAAVEVPFGELANPQVFAECDLWDVAPAASIEDAPVVSAIPALVLSGELDPITPPSYGQLVADNLTQGESFVLAGESHGASLSTCGARLIDQFLTTAGPIADTRCLADLGPPDFEAALRTRARHPDSPFASAPPSPEQLTEMVARISARWR